MGKGGTNFASTAGMATVFGIDSHARTTTICALSLGCEQQSPVAEAS
ncbi:hypothetical protein [Olsenella sp. Marseille-P4559]|nr:hypothetical protein [Olsenella sp. Marseille-P4559]